MKVMHPFVYCCMIFILLPLKVHECRERGDNEEKNYCQRANKQTRKSNVFLLFLLPYFSGVYLQTATILE